jgi:uncharacterized protein (UPF0248 family)
MGSEGDDMFAATQADLATNTLRDVLTRRGITIDPEVLDEFQAKLFDGFAELNHRIQAQDDKIEAQAKDLKDTREELQQLKNNFAGFVKADKKKQIFAVINNIIVRSKEKQSDITTFIAQTIQQAGGRRVLKNEIPITEIPNHGDKERSIPLHRVILTKDTKRLLFEGLALAKTNSPFSISNETPRFLVKDKVILEKIGFSLRAKFKDQKIRTRISLRNAQLVLLMRTQTDKEWYPATDTRAQPLMQANIIYRDSDKAPETIPTCAQFMDKFIQN